MGTVLFGENFSQTIQTTKSKLTTRGVPRETKKQVNFAIKFQVVNRFASIVKYDNRLLTLAIKKNSQEQKNKGSFLYYNVCTYIHCNTKNYLCFFSRENKKMQTNLITKDLHKRPSFIKFDFFDHFWRSWLLFLTTWTMLVSWGEIKLRNFCYCLICC